MQGQKCFSKSSCLSLSCWKQRDEFYSEWQVYMGGRAGAVILPTCSPVGCPSLHPLPQGQSPPAFAPHLQLQVPKTLSALTAWIISTDWFTNWLYFTENAFTQRYLFRVGFSQGAYFHQQLERFLGLKSLSLLQESQELWGIYRYILGSKTASELTTP